MYYFIYKTTNLINGKYYIGRHKTNNLNDGYIGSGTKLKNSIKRHGRTNFTREIICFCDNNEELDKKEREIVDQLLVDDPLSYNLMVGGAGKLFLSEEHKQKISKSCVGRSWKWTNKQKEHLRIKRKGCISPLSGSKWITDGIENKKLKNDTDVIPEGWRLGNTKSPCGHNKGKSRYIKETKIKYFYVTDIIPEGYIKG